jgi:hypothetical protein
MIFDLYALAFGLALATIVFSVAWIYERVKRPKPINREWAKFQGFWR